MQAFRCDKCKKYFSSKTDINYLLEASKISDDLEITELLCSYDLCHNCYKKLQMFLDEGD